MEVFLLLLAALLCLLLAAGDAGFDGVIVAETFLGAAAFFAACFFSCSTFSDLRQITNLDPTT